jgi:hypothetical protein
MQQTIIRTTIDVDTRRVIVLAARKRTKQDIATKPQVDFVAEQVMKKYSLKFWQIRGTTLGSEIDKIGEMLRQEMLAQSRKAMVLRQTLGF